MQALHHAHPVIATVDDHEFADGVWREGSVEHDVERDGPWAERRAACFRARWEWQPYRMPDPREPERVFRSIPLGGLAELFMIDTRSRRDEPVPATMLDPNAGQLGAEQRAWLLDALGRRRHRGGCSATARSWPRSGRRGSPRTSRTPCRR